MKDYGKSKGTCKIKNSGSFMSEGKPMTDKHATKVIRGKDLRTGK